MTLTLLFDLDNTLLGNNIDTFLPDYLRALGKHLSPYVAPEKMVPQLLHATKAMINNDSPVLTLEQAFDQAFYAPIELTKEEMRGVLKQFYGEVFPSLQRQSQ